MDIFPVWHQWGWVYHQGRNDGDCHRHLRSNGEDSGANAGRRCDTREGWKTVSENGLEPRRSADTRWVSWLLSPRRRHLEVDGRIRQQLLTACGRRARFHVPRPLTPRSISHYVILYITMNLQFFISQLIRTQIMNVVRKTNVSSAVL